MTRTLDDVFDVRANALNFVRLLLAGSVIVWHGIRLAGQEIESVPLRQFVVDFGVDGFFAISGFLIVQSWLRTPDWRRYLRARFLRIFPAFWTCLIVTAFLIAPLSTGLFGGENLTYVLKNASLWIVQWGIAGTPTDVPITGVWNGSLWTLAWEFICYLGVLVLGIAGLLKYRAVLPICFALVLIVSAATSSGLVENGLLELASRFGIMFLAGALILQYRDRIPVNAVTVVLSVVVVAASMLLPNYRVVGALPLAFLVMLCGAAIRSPRFRLKNDISYGVYIYAFPVQQVLAIWGVHTWGTPVYIVLAMLGTLPLAIASWFLVEKQALKLNKRPLRERGPSRGERADSPA